ncbi:hypothetical protein RP20_CCG025118 [Aedes albopictus]|nr:hypothetical protein RP20_CCG025118 [Aedes albopictus]
MNSKSLSTWYSLITKKLSTILTVSITETCAWEALRRKGLPEKIFGLIEAQYRAFSCRVLYNGVLSDPIRVVAGVRQECILSSLLFLIVFDEILVGAIDCELK